MGPEGPEGAAGLLDFAYYAAETNFTATESDDFSLPLTKVAGPLDAGIGYGNTGTTLTLPPGLYRLTALVSFESLDYGRYGSLVITTIYPDRGYGPFNASRVGFATEVTEQSVSTGATLVLDYTADVSVDIDILTADGALMRDIDGWLLVESFGSTLR